MKSIPILLMALAGLIGASCAREDHAVSQLSEHQDWAVLTDSDLSKRECEIFCFQKRWNPSESDVPYVLQQARLYVETRNKTSSSSDDREKIAGILARWDKYACQVIGYTKDGKKLIRLNFFVPEKEFRNWRHRYVVVADGGANFWQVDYDIEAHAFLNFGYHGDW
jgi:hypothetical protein